MPATRKRILVVEDDADLRGFYRTALTIAGFEVREATNGLEALQVIDREPPDLVVLDLLLPLVSSYVVGAELAAQSGSRRTPVVVVTALSRMEMEAVLADSILRKPVTAELLVDKLRTFLRS